MSSISFNEIKVAFSNDFLPSFDGGLNIKCSLKFTLQSSFVFDVVHLRIYAKRYYNHPLSFEAPKSYHLLIFLVYYIYIVIKSFHE